MEVDGYEGEPDVLDLYDSNYGSMTAFNSNDYHMEDSNPAAPSGTLALMPPTGFADAMVPMTVTDPSSNAAITSTTTARIDDAMHNRVLQVVLASNKTVANVPKKDMMERNSSVRLILFNAGILFTTFELLNNVRHYRWGVNHRLQK